MAEVTQLISELGGDNPATMERLLPLVYEELRKLAAVRLAHERPGQTLQATGLVHEALLRITKAHELPTWSHRGHFFAAAAQAMRRILIERARAQCCQMRGGKDWKRIDFDGFEPFSAETPDQLLAINEALEKLALIDPIAGKMVEMRYFSGLSITEIANALLISHATAYRHWEYARCWLHSELLGDS